MDNLSFAPDEKRGGRGGRGGGGRPAPRAAARPAPPRRPDPTRNQPIAGGMLTDVSGIDRSRWLVGRGNELPGPVLPGQRRDPLSGW
jgi:hypothetical protein